MELFIKNPVWNEFEANLGVLKEESEFITASKFVSI